MAYNYKKGPGLTIYQKLQLKEIASDQKTIKQMADQICADYQVVYVFVIKNNLPAKMTEAAAFRRATKHPTRSNFFNVSSKQNWLL